MPEMGILDLRHHFIGSQRGQHVQRNRLDGRPGEASVAALAANAGRDPQCIQIHADDRVERVDQRDAIGAGGNGRTCGVHDVRDVGCQLHDHRNIGRLPSPSA